MIRILFNLGLYSLAIIVLVSITKPTPPIEQTFYEIPIPYIDVPATPLYRDVDLFCLAKNIFHEAGTEPELGQYAVAQVTLNRVRDTKYPNNICSVVLERYQFSWANNKTLHWTKPSGPNWDKSYLVAKSVLNGDQWIAGMDHVQYFHADYVEPKWASKMTPVTTIGRHIFYTHH